MDSFEQAHEELKRLQEIIARHEGQIFTLRGWLLTVLGGLLAAYYTGNLKLDIVVLRAALPVITVLFLVVESRHANVVESVVERSEEVEQQMRAGSASASWYDGPRVSEACRRGAQRGWPRAGMTFILNRTFYIVVLSIVAVVAFALPARP